MNDIYFYNSLTKKKELFTPLENNKVKIYSCGPTVYSHPHIGNYRAFLFSDLLKRFFKWRKFEVIHVMNITDVGHLLHDADEGEDKIEEEARKQKKNPLEIAQIYIDSFFEANKLLNLNPANYYPRATEYVPQMISMVEKLIQKGFAYEINGNVYYDVTKFKDYGKLSGNTLDNVDSGARIEINPEKRNPQDFALWKKDEKHLQQWESPWGKGFPGWHIECSAMSSTLLGDTFDIHTGGEDNIFPHHECEIAQSEGASGRKFVNYFLHTRFLMVDGEKMSKSKGNFYTIQDLVSKGFKNSAVRYSLISSHYRQNYNFTFDGLNASMQALGKMNQFLFVMNEQIKTAKEGSPSNEIKAVTEALIDKFDKALSDDLNISEALAVVFELIREGNKSLNLNKKELEQYLTVFNSFNEVLGFEFELTSDIPEHIVKLAEERKQAKLDKDFKKADLIRGEIEKLDYVIEDMPKNNYRLKKKE